MERLSQKKFEELANKCAHRKPNQSGIFSKTDDSYICGTWDEFKTYIKKGITEQIQSIDGKGRVAQIGFNPEEQKWYGWSHRAGYGFGIGYKVKKGDLNTQSGYSSDSKYYKEDMKKISKYPVGFKAKTLEDCKQLAILFANSVS